jgi:hypothetical protein
MKVFVLEYGCVDLNGETIVDVYATEDRARSDAITAATETVLEYDNEEENAVLDLSQPSLVAILIDGVTADWYRITEQQLVE